MKQEVNPEKVEKLVLETAKALTGYIKEHQKDDVGTNPSQDYVDGWIEGIDQMVTELFGRKNEEDYFKEQLAMVKLEDETE